MSVNSELGRLAGPGVSLGRILGVPSIDPLLGGGPSQRVLSTHPPPARTEAEARLPPTVFCVCSEHFRIVR